MLSRFSIVFLAIAVISALAAPADEISLIRADGSAGWSAPIAVESSGARKTPLAVPVWFAKFPGLKIPLTTNETFDLDSARGKVVLIDWWASWCAPCVKELPHLEKLHQKRGPEGLIALAVNANEPTPTAIDAAKRFGLTMRIGVYLEDVYKTLGVHALPTVLLLDKQGRLRSRWDGYKPGLEDEIDAMVVKLLADDKAGTTRDFGSVTTGSDAMRASWFRDLQFAAEGVAGVPAGAAGAARVVVSSNDEIVSFDALGETVGRVKTEYAAGRLMDLGARPDGSYELLGFRPGAVSAGVIAFRSGSEHAVTLPAPATGAAVSRTASAGAHRIVFATLRGAAEAAPADTTATLVKASEKVRSVSATASGTVVTVAEDGTLARLDGKGAKSKAAAGAQLLAASDAGAITAPRTVVASVTGRFLPRDGRQIAVATFSGRLALLDEATGAALFESQWTELHDLAAVDLDGDGRDELLVAVGKSIVVLTSAAP